MFFCTVLSRFTGEGTPRLGNMRPLSGGRDWTVCRNRLVALGGFFGSVTSLLFCENSSCTNANKTNTISGHLSLLFSFAHSCPFHKRLTAPHYRQLAFICTSPSFSPPFHLDSPCSLRDSLLISHHVCTSQRFPSAWRPRCPSFGMFLPLPPSYLPPPLPLCFSPTQKVGYLDHSG